MTDEPTNHQPMGRDPHNRDHLSWQLRVARLISASIGDSPDPDDYPALLAAISEIRAEGRLGDLPAALVACCAVVLTRALGGEAAARAAVTMQVAQLAALLDDGD